jgi:Protein of unknown function (DUF3991)/Toprim-like
MTPRLTPPQIDQLRSIPLPAVLRLCQAQPDRHDPAKWHTADSVLSVQGSQFIDWKYGVGGGGAIDLVMHLRDCRFADALHWLERHFSPLAVGWVPAAPSLPPARRPLKLPPPVPSQLWRVQRSLRCHRRIPSALIDCLIASGQLYADHRANAVFVLRDHQSNPVGAELRGTTPRSWRGLAPGSQKDQGYFAIGNDRFQTTILCESAIDAISCFALYSDCQCISTSGARSNPRWLAALIEQGQSVLCGFDADATGDQMAQALIERSPSVRRLRPPLHDWNDALSLLTSARPPFHTDSFLPNPPVPNLILHYQDNLPIP